VLAGFVLAIVIFALIAAGTRWQRF